MKYIIHIISVFLLATVLASCTDNEAMLQRLSYVSQCNRADTVFTEKWLPTVNAWIGGTYYPIKNISSFNRFRIQVAQIQGLVMTKPRGCF